MVLVVEHTAYHRCSHGFTLWHWLTGSIWLSMWKRHLGHCNVKGVGKKLNKKKKSQNTCKKNIYNFLFYIYIEGINMKYKIETCDRFFQYSHYWLESRHKLSLINKSLITLLDHVCGTDSLVPAQPIPETVETVRRLYQNWPHIAITSLQCCITDLDVLGNVWHRLKGRLSTALFIYVWVWQTALFLLYQRLETGPYVQT